MRKNNAVGPTDFKTEGVNRGFNLLSVTFLVYCGKNLKGISVVLHIDYIYCGKIL